MKNQHKIRMIMRIFLGASLVLYGAASFADTASMNETLARINQMLSHINPLINQAESEQDKNARVQFQFDVLRQDIGRIQAGILTAIHGTTIEPRQITPLSGDYLSASETSATIIQPHGDIP